MPKKKIILTGGGTAGHVTPNIALMNDLKKANYEIHYIGSMNGIEKDLIGDTEATYYPIASGKLRRYFDVKNFTDPFKVLKGCAQAHRIIRKVKPDIIFSKGGFVSVPVVFAGKLNRIPTLVHESDMTPGLANKLSIPFASKVCVTFSETLNHLPENKGFLTGTPIRRELMDGRRDKGLAHCHFTTEKPVLMMIGGSLGSKSINKVLRDSLSEILKDYQLIHLCGKGNIDLSLEEITGYCQFEYVKEELPDLFAAADLIISRAGANSISELLALKKPNILIPLPLSASRGDQILNAKSFKKNGYSAVIQEEDLTRETLLATIQKVLSNKGKIIRSMDTSKTADGIHNVMHLILEYSK